MNGRVDKVKSWRMGYPLFPEFAVAINLSLFHYPLCIVLREEWSLYLGEGWTSRRKPRLHAKSEPAYPLYYNFFFIFLNSSAIIFLIIIAASLLQRRKRVARWRKSSKNYCCQQQQGFCPTPWPFNLSTSPEEIGSLANLEQSKLRNSEFKIFFRLFASSFFSWGTWKWWEVYPNRW